MDEAALAAIENRAHTFMRRANPEYLEACAIIGQDLFTVTAEVRRLRSVMRAVYEDGVHTRGNRTAAVVEPLWRALHKETPDQPKPTGGGEEEAADGP